MAEVNRKVQEGNYVNLDEDGYEIPKQKQEAPKQEQKQEPIKPPPPKEPEWKMVLGIRENDKLSKSLIKKKYRRLTFKYQPDRNKIETKKDMQKITKAYDDALKHLGERK